MAYLNEGNYKDTIAVFPNEFVPEEKKDKDWFLQLAKAVMSEYVSDRTTVPYSKREYFSYLRRYGNGTQPEEEAMSQVFSNYGKKESAEDAERARKGFHNIDPSILPIMVRFKQTILGMFQDVDFEISANAVDKKSADEKEQRKWQLYADTLVQDVVDEVDKTTGITKAKDNKWKPKDVNELNLYESLGGIRLAAEIGIEKLVSVIEDDSRMSEIKDKIIEDAVDIGYIAIEAVTDRYDQKVTYKYRMPDYCIGKYDRDSDFDGQKYAGYITSMSIEDLRKTGQFKEEELRSLAQKYFDINRESYGTQSSFSEYNNFDNTRQNWGYDAFKVDVLKTWFIGAKSEYRKKQTTSSGRLKSDKPTFWGDNSKGAYRYDPPVLYTCSWVIGMGSKYIFNEGLEYDVAYKDSVPQIPLQIIKLPGPSITERCVPNLRNMQVAWIKFQNALTKSRPPGLAINYDSVQSMGVKGEKLRGTEIIRMTLNEGNIIYRATTKNATPIPGAGKPVYELEGGMGKQLDEFIRTFELNRQLIQETSGITPEASGGGSVPERQSAKLSELMYSNANNNLKPIIKKYHDLKLRVSNIGVLKVMDSVRWSDKAKEYYTASIGKIYIDSLYLPESKTYRDISINLTLKPDTKQKDRILGAAIEAMKAGKDGVPGISHADYMLIEMIVEHGNLKEAQKRLDLLIRESRERYEKRQAEAQQRSEENQIRLKQEEAKKEKAKLAAEKELKQMELAAERKLKLELADKEIEKAKIVAGIQDKTDQNKSINVV